MHARRVDTAALHGAPGCPYRAAAPCATATAWLTRRLTPTPAPQPSCTPRPNRGPVILSIDEVDSLLDCLPPPRKEEEGEDTEERQQIKTLNAARARLVELQQSLLVNAVTPGS